VPLPAAGAKSQSVAWIRLGRTAPEGRAYWLHHFEDKIILSLEYEAASVAAATPDNRYFQRLLQLYIPKATSHDQSRINPPLIAQTHPNLNNDGHNSQNLWFTLILKIAFLFQAQVKAENVAREGRNYLKIQVIFPDLGHFRCRDVR
jgi:hypothetical protein